MLAIIVDDEPIMIKSFKRLSAGIDSIQLAGAFENSADALAFAEKNNIDIAFLDIAMPDIDGIELAKKLREIDPRVLIVFVSAYDEYIRDANNIGADYYIVKPYTENALKLMAERMKLLADRRKKDIYIQMFGKFNVLKNGMPIPLRGKAKEILALIAAKRGREISNEEIYSTVWESRAYGNIEMKVYYNALKRLRDCLAQSGIPDLLISTARGQMLNVKIADCDYYGFLDGDPEERKKFNGEFLSDYFWAEEILGGIMSDIMRTE